jgi:hypothetical protein
MNNLTIVIPVSEDPKVIKDFIIGNEKILTENRVIVVNRRGGEELKPFSTIWFSKESTFWDARREGLDLVETEYTLCLDSDTILPEGYIEEALTILQLRRYVAVVAIDYEDLQGHLAFGTSIWRTVILKDLYDWNKNRENPSRGCECVHMWSKVRRSKFRVETLNMRAKHLKIEGGNKTRLT